MTCSTYLGENDHLTPTSDDELNQLLAEVRSKTGRDWRLNEHITERRRWCRKPIEIKRYTLYLHIAGPEFQIMNFYRPNNSDQWCSSINTTNSAGFVAAYFYGILGAAPEEDAVKRMREAMELVLADSTGDPVYLIDEEGRALIRNALVGQR